MKIHITGELPLEFDGILEKEWSNKYNNNGSVSDRYHRIALYSGNEYYVMSIEFFSLYGEHQYSVAAQSPSLENLAKYLQSFDPLEKTIITSRHSNPPEKEKELKNIKFAWQELITEVFQGIEVSQKIDLPIVPNLLGIDNADMVIIREICQELQNQSQLQDISMSQLIKQWIQYAKE